MEIVGQLTKPENLVAILAALAVFGVVISFFLPLLQTNKLETRLKAVSSQRERLRQQSRAQLDKKNAGGLRRDDKSVAGKVSKQLNLAELLEDPNAAENLAKAGLRGPGPMSAFYFARLILPVVFLFIAVVIIFGVYGGEVVPLKKYGGIIGAVALGFYGPNLYVSNLAGKRQASIMLAFPDALDMLLICVESGMSVEVGFSRVSQEIGSISPELAEEFGLTVAELSYLPDRRQAYDNLAYRTGHEGVKAVCMALAQAEKYGTPLGDALRVMAKENRDMRMSAAEKKAAALPAKLTVPMILFFLPVLFMVVLTPAYIGWKESQNTNLNYMQIEEGQELPSKE